MVQDNHDGIILFYYKFTRRKYIVLKHSKYKDFDTFQEGKKMEIQNLTPKDLENIKVIDINFILENRLKETYYITKQKNFL